MNALNTELHFSSQTDEWSTPPAFVQAMENLYGQFTLDPCATVESAKAPRYFTTETDGLSKPWTGRVWMNPPYGRSIGDWTAKARESVENDTADMVVGLLPARIDTRWFHRDVMAADHILLIKGRLKFGGSPTNAPFPSIVAVWTKDRRAGKRPHFYAYDLSEFKILPGP